MEAAGLRHGDLWRRLLLYGGRAGRPRGAPGSLGSRCGAARVRLRGGSRGAERGWQRPELVEDLDRLVVLRLLGQQLDGRRERLAGSRRRTESGVRVRLEQPGQDLPQRLGNALRRSRGAVRGEELHQGLRVGLLPLQQIERHQADGEEVGGEVRLRALHLLRREVTGRAHHVVGLRQARLALAHGDSEVGQPQMRPAGPGGVQQYVGGFDVAMDDSLRVHRRETGQQLVEQETDEARRQRPVVADHMGQRSAAHQVHGEQDLVVVGGPAGRCEHVRVIDPQGLLAYETQQGVRVALLEHLGRHIPAAPVVPGTPDGAHTATSDRVDQLVPTSEDLTHRAALAPSRPVRWTVA